MVQFQILTETLYISMQLVDDHVDNSSANSSIDTHSNVEPSNHESFKKANGLPVCPLKTPFERLFC